MKDKNKDFWKFAKEIKKEISEWPEWKKKAAEGYFITPVRKRKP